MFEALVHHLGRIAKSAGCGWDSDCEAEIRAEVQAIDEYLSRLESRLHDREREQEERERTALWTPEKK